MLKKISSLLVLAFIFQISFAQHIEINDAQSVANHFISVKNKAAGYQISSQQNLTSKSGSILAYIFDLSPVGYIVVNADKDQIPVIAYSFNNPFSDNSVKENPLQEMILADLSLRSIHKDHYSKEQIDKNQRLWNALLVKSTVKADTTFEQWPAVGTTSTEGWVLTKWNQSAPYNNMCPMDLGHSARSLTGCPATAMAQIINYHQTLNGTRINDADDYYHNYGSNQFYIDDDYLAYDFPSFPQLNLYLDTLEGLYFTKAPLTNNDLASLMFGCGVATKSVYNSTGSGTFGVNQALDGILRFGFSTAVLLDTSVSNPFHQIISNIKDSLPVFLAVVDAAWSTGHNLVIDGYNTDDYYHLNFGWGGAYDGWYYLPSGMPYNLTVIEGVIVDIDKNTSLNVERSNVESRSAEVFPNPAQQSTTLSFTSDITGRARIMLFDAYGKKVTEQQTSVEPKRTSSVKINLENLKQGVYTYYIVNQSETFTGKLIKL